jgi:MFS family permease
MSTAAGSSRTSSASSSANLSPAPPASLGYAWYVVLVLMVCYTLSFIDRQILSLLIAPMKRDLAISDTRVGLLQGLAFALFYTILGLPLGRIADTGSRRRLVSLGVLFWSVATALCSAAGSFFTLFLARMGVGVGEATLAPGAFSMITDYFPKEKLGKALSVYSMGIFLGSGLALIVGGSVVQVTATMPALDVPVLGMIASWRLTFLLVGAPGLLVGLWAMTIKEPVRKSLLRSASGGASTLTVSQVATEVKARWQSVLGISFAMVFQSMCTYSFNAWGPAFFQRVHHWTPAQTGRGVGIITLTFGCLGMWVGGALADRWSKQGIRESHLRIGVIAGIGQLIFFVPAMTASDPYVTLALLGPAMFFLALPSGTAYAALQLILPNQIRGQVSALFVFIFNLGGLSLGPLLPGVFNDYFFHDGQKVGTSVAISITIGSILAVIIWRMIYAPYRRHSEEMDALMLANAK